MNWMAVISLLIKYGPDVVTFIQKEEPVIQAFIKDVEAAFGGTGTTAPQLGAILQQFLGALNAGTPPAAAAGAVLSGPAFVFPTQVVPQSTGFKS